MGCCSSSQDDVRRPRESGEVAGNYGRGGARSNNVRVERQNPGDPYCGTIDKIENIIPDTYVGEGIKRTHAFTIELTESQYAHWKDQFWETRCEGRPEVWEVLKRCWEVDHVEAAELIKENGIILQNNRLTFCYDSTGKSYIVPAAWINEPVGYGADKEKEALEAKSKPQETKSLNLVLRNASSFEDEKIKIKDSWSVVELKEKYAKLKKIDDWKKIRILYYGKELKDDFNLYNYEINDEIILIAVVNHHLYDDDE